MRLIAFFLATLSTAPCFAQSARYWSYIIPDRIAISGNQFLDSSRNPCIPTGYNDDIVTTVTPSDFQQMAAQNAKSVRISFGFLNNSDCSHSLYPVQTLKDYYNYNYPTMGYLDPTRWPKVVAAAQSAAANGIWVNLVVSGGNCSFFNSQTLLNQYYAMWAYVAQTFRKTPHVFIYEVLSEPHPSGLNAFTGYVDDGSGGCNPGTPSGVAGKILCVQSAGTNVFLYAGYPTGDPGNLIAGTGIPSGVTIECNSASPVSASCPGTYTGGGSVGAYTVQGTYLLNASTNFSTGALPISISTADGFNPHGLYDNGAVTGLCRATFAAIRAVDQQTIVSCSPALGGNSRAIAGIAMPDQSNWAANFDFFELPAYVMEVKNNPPPAYPKVPKPSLNYTGYPSVGGSSTAYPAYSDTSGLAPNVGCNYPNIGGSVLLTQTFLSTLLTNCPIAFSQQYAVPSYANQIGTNTLTPNAVQYLGDTLGTIKGLGLGFFVWVFNGAGTIWDGTNQGSSGGAGANYLLLSWIPKDGNPPYNCTTITYSTGASSTCSDYISTVSSHF
jgi:hypothetical protein